MHINTAITVEISIILLNTLLVFLVFMKRASAPDEYIMLTVKVISITK